MLEFPNSAIVGFPVGGAVRVHPTPDQLPKTRRLEERPAYRYDDPDDPSGSAAFRVRYLASTLRGCLLEVLSQFRPMNDETTRLLDAVLNVDDDLAYSEVPRRGLGSYLAKVNVGSCQLFEAADVVSIHDPGLLAALDRHPRVRYILTTEPSLSAWGPDAHLDEAKVRFDDQLLGRPLTQGCARVIHDASAQAAGIHYRSKHDDAEDCWALFDRARVTFTHTVALDSLNAEHRAAVLAVAALWNLELPPAWGTAPAASERLERRKAGERRQGQDRRQDSTIDLTEGSVADERRVLAERRRKIDDRRQTPD